MTESTAPAAVETPIAVNRHNRKKEGVSLAVFVAAVVAGNKAGKTNAEVAAELNMKPTSFSVRLSNLRTDIEDGKISLGDIPMEKALEKLTLERSAGGGRPAVDKGKAVADALMAEFGDLLKGIEE